MPASQQNSSQIARDIQATLLRYKAGMISLSQARQELSFQQALLKAYELAEIEQRLLRIEELLEQRQQSWRPKR